MDDRVAAALENTFPDRTVETVASTGPSWNDANRTVGVEFADGERIYLKLAIDGDGTRITRERAVIAFVSATDAVAVPRVVASDVDRETPYLVTEPVPGRSLEKRWMEANPAERAALARAVGRALARLHRVRFDDHGHVTGSGPEGLDVETGPWTTVLVERIEAMRSLVPADRFDRHFDRVIEAVEADRDLLEGAPATLVHGDPARPNCFCDERGVGFLDWEIAHVGDPARELHRACDQQIAPLRGCGPDRLVEALHEGYRAEAGGLPSGYERRRPIYDAVRFLGVSGFFEKYVAYREEPADELAAWVEGEMDRRLARLSDGS
ncbi:phosphotransferase family protein [Saliphagus infecundisoli]|uniref:Phosphotransferase family protein n=1 Tax=Saliphagus infecundisoli TaxID=1849069 RepID=A0ABD5QGP4_9EURY|nr:phosphotransferase [Saliphagus infecundisoli]